MRQSDSRLASCTCTVILNCPQPPSFLQHRRRCARPSWHTHHTDWLHLARWHHSIHHSRPARWAAMFSHQYRHSCFPAVTVRWTTIGGTKPTRTCPIRPWSPRPTMQPHWKTFTTTEWSTARTSTASSTLPPPPPQPPCSSDTRTRAKPKQHPLTPLPQPGTRTLLLLTSHCYILFNEFYFFTLIYQFHWLAFNVVHPSLIPSVSWFVHKIIILNLYDMWKARKRPK